MVDTHGSPAQVDVTGKVTTQMDGTDFRRIRSGKRLLYLSALAESEYNDLTYKDSPRKACQDLRDAQHSKRIGKDHDKDDPGQGVDCRKHDFLWYEAVDCPTVELYISTI